MYLDEAHDAQPHHEGRNAIISDDKAQDVEKNFSPSRSPMLNGRGVLKRTESKTNAEICISTQRKDKGDLFN